MSTTTSPQLVAGGCPDCICTPTECLTDTEGQHCIDINCAACLHGCLDDEHDMTTTAEVQTR
jgi:hypothetical protein